MTDDGDDGAAFLEVEGLGVLSRAAFQLHSFAIVNSVTDGTPGFVADEYLEAISAEATIAALELEMAGLWARREGGYFVVADDMVKIVIDSNERRARLAAVCRARGRHIPDEEDHGWISCSHCFVPLQRPDGGPVAASDSGPLSGPDA